MPVYIILSEEKASKFRKEFNKRNICSCGFSGLHTQPIQGYTPHNGGYLIDGKLYWLFIECPKCGNGWSLWKLGTKRERY